MAEITVGSKTLTIPAPRLVECAAIIKKWYSLEGDTPQEILDAWSQHIIDEIKVYLVENIGNGAYDESMEGSHSEADQAKNTAEEQADTDLVIA